MARHSGGAARTDQQQSIRTKLCSHLAATLSSWALATVVSTQTRQHIRIGSNSRMDILCLSLGSIQLATMLLPYIGFHKAGGPALFPPISCVNHYSVLRRVGNWLAFSLLAGGMHAWTCLTMPGNPMQSPELITKAFAYIPSAGLVLLAGNPVPLRGYTTAVVARGTEVEWLIPASLSLSWSKKVVSRRDKTIIRGLMAAHLLGALVLLTVPLAGALLRKEWYTKLCACIAVALWLPSCNRRLPIFHLASDLLETKVMDTYPEQDDAGGAQGVTSRRRPAWTNSLNATRGGHERWKTVNRLGVLEHVLLNSLMMVVLSLQHHDEIHGPVGWVARAIALGWNVAFASFGGRWWLAKLLAAATEYGGAASESGASMAKRGRLRRASSPAQCHSRSLSAGSRVVGRVR